MKTLKFTTSHSIFTHFYYKFLKYFYIFRILTCPGSFWYQWRQDSFIIKGEKYCPQEMVVLIQFLLHSNLHDSLINNIKMPFLQHENSLQESRTKLQLETIGSIKIQAS